MTSFWTLTPRKLRPTELVRLLNSTPLGEVISERQLFRHRSRAGFRVGDARHVDLFRYVAWLVAIRHEPEPEPDTDPYEALKERARTRNAALSAAGRDIGELPEVVDPERKARAMTDFRFFCENYFAAAFTLAWSPDHLKVIAKIERAVLTGGLFAHAMPRGSGKTTLTEIACIWAILTGARPFVCLIGSTADRARAMLDSIKTELECNDRLLEDFPEAVYPIHRLERIHNRANGQLYQGAPTRIAWTADKIVMPTIPGSRCAGAVITVMGLEGGNIRGQKHKLADGTILRPSLAVLDDPQTTESAWSAMQNQRREALLAGDVLGMAGPGQKIAAILCCTVIRPGDMADNILDRKKHPLWQGERTKLVYAFPANETLWARYAELRAESFRNDGDGHQATEFYCQNREAMDEGAVVAWPERHNEDELSAVQHAMNLRFRDEAAFFAEYQNEPLLEEIGDGDLVTAEQVAERINHRGRGELPVGCEHVTMFIDVQASLLFYVVAGWEEDFTGYVLDYGSYPDQHRPYFTLRDARRTLSLAAPGTGLEGAIHAGLDRLTMEYLGREWKRDDGALMRIDRCLVDANWGQSTDIVYQFCRQSPHSNVIMPSHGRFIGASSKPFSEYQQHPGERLGLNWRIPSLQARRTIRHVVYDTNYWKSFICARFLVPMGERGCLSLFGNLPEHHRLFAEHLTAEYRVKTEGRGRVVDEWKLRPGSPDNHWLDGLVGCAVAASMQGVALSGMQKYRVAPQKRLTMAELAAQARQRRH